MAVTMSWSYAWVDQGILAAGLRDSTTASNSKLIERGMTKRGMTKDGGLYRPCGELYSSKSCLALLGPINIHMQYTWFILSTNYHRLLTSTIIVEMTVTCQNYPAVSSDAFLHSCSSNVW